MTDADSTQQVKVADDLLEMAAELAAVRRAKKQVVTEEAALREKLLAALKALHADAALTADGLPAFSIRRSSRTNISRKKLEAMYPSIFEDVRSESEIVTLEVHDENL